MEYNFLFFCITNFFFFGTVFHIFKLETFPHFFVFQVYLFKSSRIQFPHLYEWWHFYLSCLLEPPSSFTCHLELIRSTLSCCRQVLLCIIFLYIPLRYSYYSDNCDYVCIIIVSFTRLLSYSALSIVGDLFPFAGTLCGRCHRLCAFLFITEVLILIEIMTCNSSLTD